MREKIAKYFDKQSVFGGMAFTCINRENSGVVNHLYKGFITIGHITNDSNELKIANSLWAPTKVQVETNSSLLKARWEKLCWNIPFNGIGVCSGGISTDIIINDPQLYLSAQNLMKEVINIANADLTFNNSNQQMGGDRIAKGFSLETNHVGGFTDDPSGLTRKRSGYTREGIILEEDAIILEGSHNSRDYKVGIRVFHQKFGYGKLFRLMDINLR